MLSEKTIRIVEGVRGLVVGNAVTITRRFYEWGFETNSEAVVFCNQARQRTGDQRKTIPGAIGVCFAPFEAPAVMTAVGEFGHSAETGTNGRNKVIDDAWLPGDVERGHWAGTGFVATESTREWIPPAGPAIV